MKVSDLKRKGIKVAQVRGDEVLAHCPFHQDSHPSFALNLRKKVFYCYACGAKGNFGKLGFTTKADNVRFGDYTNLRERLSDGDAPEEVFELPRDYTPFTGGWLDKPFWEYLHRRGISGSIAGRFRIGYCSRGDYQDRIIVPLGLGFVARSIHGDKTGKLIFGRDFRRYLYPLGLPKSAMLFNFVRDRKLLFLVEGVFDVLRLDGYGISATAILGSALSQAQLELICDSEVGRVMLCFDGDEAGENGMEQAAWELSKYFEAEDIYLVGLPKGQDPASCGKSTLRECLRSSQSYKPHYNFFLPTDAAIQTL